VPEALTLLASMLGALDPRPLILAILHIHIHLHVHLHIRIHLHFLRHHFRGPAVDYAGVAVASAISWVGLPGPGEPVLFAAGVLAAQHRLELWTVVTVAFLCATGGGILGWLIGLLAGRTVLTGRGPLRAARIKILKRGEDLYARHAVLAIILSPAIVAGVNRVPSRVYQPVNLISALVWSVGLGVGAFFVGPPVLDLFDDIGAGASAVVIAAIAVAVVLELRRRRLRRRSAN
jgi:membrane protein DedA with SNARE-associated domain